MPLPLGALIAGGSALLGGGLDSLSSANLNRRNRRFAREMYERQYGDNLAFWHQQNNYNSPQAQMQRFRDAGLNPNLIYGAGNSGPAGPISTPDVQTPQTRSPEWGKGISAAGLAGINASYDLDIKQATVDNLKAQHDVIINEALLKQAQTQATKTSAETGAFKLNFETEMRDVSADARREQLRQTRTQTDLAIRKDAREALTNTSNLQEAVLRMAKMQIDRNNSELENTRIRADINRINAETSRIRENVKLMVQDGTLKRLDIRLREQGINPNDPTYLRMMGQALPQIVEKGKSYLTDVWNFFMK